jgi:cell division septal protein FtsQ
VLDVVVKSSRQEKLERIRRWRRGLQWGVLTTLAITLVAGSRQAVARYFWQNPDLRLASSAEVRTNGTLTHEDILRHAGLAENTHVYDVDLRAVRERLESLPNVRHANVRRELPGRLVIEIEERRPVVWLTCDQPQLNGYTTNPEKGACLLDEEGHLFLCTELTSELLDLPALHLRRLRHSQPGAHLTIVPVQTGLELLRRLRDTFGTRGVDVSEIHAPNEWSLTVQMSDGLTVTFGYENLDDQIDRLVRVVDYAAAHDRLLHTVNLLPRKNVPVTFLATDASNPSPRLNAGVGSQRPVSGQPVRPPTPAASPASSSDSQLEAILGGGR